MEDRFCTYKRVGYFNNKLAEDLGVKFTGTIYASPGVLKHIRKKHGKHLSKKVLGNIIGYMKCVIEGPDYVGVYCITDDGAHIEFIKEGSVNILIGIEIDYKKDYINVSTMYPITDSKIDSRIFSGKLIKYTD